MLEHGLSGAALGAAGDLVATDQDIQAVTASEAEERSLGRPGAVTDAASMSLRVVSSDALDDRVVGEFV